MLFEENFTIFVVSYGAICGTRHVESVFALSLTENVEVFNNNGTTNSTHSCLDNGMGFLYPYPISIRVWGIASFIVVKVLPQPSVR